MAPVLANFTLPATVLFTVVIPGLRDLNTADPSNIVTELLHQRQLAALPDGYIAHPDIGVAYKVHNLELDWTAARRQCISEGAHLADIDSSLKLELLMPQLKSYWTWIGIFKMHDDTEWVSSHTGLTKTTLPWAVMEPYGHFYCVVASKPRRGLAIFECNSPRPYVCELPIPENYDARGIEETTEVETDGS